jgi:hypothetical protein
MNKMGNTGAGVLVNGHWFTFDIAPGNKIGMAGPAFGKTAKVFAEAEGRIKPGVPFDVEILIKDRLMTYAINGEKIGEAKSFPTAMETVPSSDVGSVHKLGVITALRSWRADLKIYEFKVETDGEIVPLPEMQTIYQSGSATKRTPTAFRRCLNRRRGHSLRLPRRVATVAGTPQISIPSFAVAKTAARPGGTRLLSSTNTTTSQGIPALSSIRPRAGSGAYRHGTATRFMKAR